MFGHLLPQNDYSETRAYVLRGSRIYVQETRSAP